MTDLPPDVRAEAVDVAQVVLAEWIDDVPAHIAPLVVDAVAEVLAAEMRNEIKVARHLLVEQAEEIGGLRGALTLEERAHERTSAVAFTLQAAEQWLQRVSPLLKTEYDRRGEWMRSAGSTMAALAVQCAELREALARVDPQAAAALHAKHKEESQR